MHLPDGFLAPQLALALWLVTGLIVALSLRRLAASDPASASTGRPVLMGLVGAFIFAAQMFNFPVATGTSGHLLGGVLAGALLGPWAGTVVMVTVIGVQAVLFQDGGLLALGANAFNMGIIGTLGGTLFSRAVALAFGSGRTMRIAAAGFAGWLSVVAGAGITTVQLGLSGTTDVSIGLPAMLGVHALIGVGEAAITISALAFIARTAPDLLDDQVRPAATTMRRIVTGAGAALLVAALAALFASSDPDGLNRVAAALGFSGLESQAPIDIFAGYSLPGLHGAASTIAAAIIGVGVVAGLVVALSRLAASRRGDR